ncbi:MAG: class I SAM-dependent methyltransferase [Planctomycetota bacterium]|jgi:hypothetical protein
MLRRVYRRFVASFVHRTFNLWQRLGVHVSYAYYGTPIPNTRELGDALWANPSALPGLDMNEKGQLELLALLESGFKDEYSALARDRAWVPAGVRPRDVLFKSPDAEVAYSMVRHLKPRRVLEIGAGFSTLVLARALRANRESAGAAGGDTPELVANEPYPKRFLKRFLESDPTPPVTLLVRRAQEVPLADFEELGANDILFIDSSHIVKIGSDLHYLVLEVLPRLAKGVAVHFHDICMPLEYPRSEVVGKQFFFNEQYFLQAFLAFNGAFDVALAGRYLQLRHPDRFEQAFGAGAAGGASSLWLVRAG